MADGWRRPRVVLDWTEREGHPFSGLRIVMRRRVLREALTAWRDGDAAGGLEERWADLSPQERADVVMQQVEQLAGLIDEWNLADDDGEIQPVSADAILDNFNLGELNALWDAYAEGTSRLAAPLSRSSDAGQRSEVEEIVLPTEPLTTETTPDDSPAT